MFLVGKLAPKYKDPLVWVPPSIAIKAQNAVTGSEIPSMFISQENATPVDCIGITAYDISAPFDLEAINSTPGEFLSRHPQFKPSKERPGAVELSGKVTISEDVIIPKNVPLIIKPGADITMKPRVSILSYGGLYSIGTEKDSIRIHGDGYGIPWGVLAVLRPTDKKVIVKYTRFSDAGQAFVNATLFTGGFAVHDGDLELTHSRFVKMASEDGMNLKNGHILMANTIFEHCNADNVDLDFCSGEVRDCIFRRSGFNGDGLDVSGARDLVISGCTFDNLTDKGISVGENSHPTIINCLMRGNSIGISCKDLSNPKIANCTFIGNGLAIEAKRKKPFFGGGSGHFVNCVFSENKTLLEEDYFSVGKIKIEASLADQPTDWKSGSRANIRFANADQRDYQLESTFVHRNNFKLIFPDWFPKTFNIEEIKHPGIFSVSKED
jgi:parallel beta-helix repeat protein